MIEVELKPDERIVGFKSRLGSNDKSQWHEDFQFMVCPIS
jgi:hypothetical protein